jgi:hypothetical protein
MSGPRFIAGTCNACGESVWSDRDHHCEVATLRAQLAAYKGHSPEVIERRFAEYESTAAALRERAEAAERERDEEREFYCGCEHHRPGSGAVARWDEDGCCQSCGVDVDPWTIRALTAEARASLLEAALLPFAALATELPAEFSDSRPLYAYGSSPALTAGDFRRALPPTRGGGNEGRGTT